MAYRLPIPSYQSALEAIESFPGITSKELAEEIGVSHGHTKGIVRKLREWGLVHPNGYIPAPKVRRDLGALESAALKEIKRAWKANKVYTRPTLSQKLNKEPAVVGCIAHRLRVKGALLKYACLQVTDAGKAVAHSREDQPWSPACAS